MTNRFVLIATASTLLALAVFAEEPKAYLGQNSCQAELESSDHYGIRLDETRKAYLNAYALKGKALLMIVQRHDDKGQCGIIRDVVQSLDPNSSFVWECVDQTSPSDVVVGTWPKSYSKVSGPAVEAWRIDLKELKFVSVHAPVKCKAKNYAGNDEGDSLVEWARQRAAKHSSKSKN